MKFKDQQTSEKLRGGYYTPSYLSDYISQWILEKQNATKILEPSCGDGVFIRSLAKNGYKNEIIGYELLDTEVKKSREELHKLGLYDSNIIEGDFLGWATQNLENEIFDAVVGNPPFIRYQFLENLFQDNSKSIFDKLNFKFTKHTNSWVPFVLASISLLKPKGRLGMIIPSEIFNLIHAQSLREFISQKCSKVLIIDPKEIWFEDTLQGVVILLAEKLGKEDKQSGISVLTVENNDFLTISPETLFNKANYIQFSEFPQKWTGAILSKNEIELIKKITSHQSVYKFSDIASVEVGIVTGANDFFLVNEDVVKRYNLNDYSYPMFGKSQHCKGIIYDINQHADNKEQNLPTNFIYIEEEYRFLPNNIQKYIKSGESLNYDKRYKCRIRTPWYKVPSVYATNIGMLKRSHEAPRLILNKINAYTTDTAYRIKSNRFPSDILVCSFLNPLTMIYSELEGRFYGGGVLELVPSEIRQIYIPIVEDIEYDIDYINRLVKDGKIEDVIEKQGRVILERLGFSNDDNVSLINIWKKLKNKRLRK